MSENATGEERRHFHRIQFHTDVTVECPGNSWRVELIDISLKGALIQEPDGFEPCDGQLTLILPLDGGVSIRMSMAIAHREEGHLGCEWNDIDVESFSHLRRLLELNLGDPDLVDRELSELTAG